MSTSLPCSRWFAFDAVVSVPGVHVGMHVGPLIKLHEAYAALHQSARHQALLTERLGDRIVQSVQLLGLVALASDSTASGAQPCIR